jgi:hypothetical protein
MKIRPLFIFFCFVAVSNVKSQSATEYLNRLSNQLPIQKIHLHLDRENYVAGQTAWFKAYLSTDYLPDTISTSLHTEMIDASTLKSIKKVTCPVLFGAATGSIDIADSTSTGYYLLRSYTSEMAAANNEFAFQQYFFVFGKAKPTTGVTIPETVNLDFFPEGGNLVNGLSTSVAFKAYSTNGLPVSISGTVYNQKGLKITTLSSTHDGMGMFDITPTNGEQYYVIPDGKTERYNLPAATDKGIVLTVIPHPQGSFFEIKQNTGDETFTAAYMIGQMQHHIVFKKNFSVAASSMEGVVNTSSLHSGIMQITVFNKNGMPLAERLCFVNNKEYIQPISLLADTINFSAGARNRVSVLLKDTVQGQLSVAITDPEMDMNTTRPQNIVSSLLLTSDLKGYVHNAAWYFFADDEAVKNALDLLMMTNGWRRFKWIDIANPIPAIKKQDPFITIKGSAFLKDTKRPFADKQLLLMINSTSTKKSRSSHFLETDKDGKFRIDSLVIFDKNRLLFTDVRGKKSQYIDIELSADSIGKTQGLSLQNLRRLNKPENNIVEKWKMDYDAIVKANGLLLDEVRVKVIKKSPMQVVDENYTTGMFSGDATKAVDLVNSDEASTYMNIFDYLQTRVNGLTVTNDGLDYGLVYRQGPSMSSMGNIPMTIFLDEVETDASVIATISPNQIALLKIYSTFVGGWGNAPGGAIAIYTKKGADYVSGTSLANIKMYNGYSVTKEFYAPDYKISADGLSADNRATLDWRPTIFVNNINPRIPVSFYNNSRSKSFKVIVEGMTNTGKLIWAEKIFKK